MAGYGAQAAVDEYAPAAAELCFVGKRGGAKSARQDEINELLVHHCLQVTPLCLKDLLCALSAAKDKTACSCFYGSNRVLGSLRP